MHRNEVPLAQFYNQFRKTPSSFDKRSRKESGLLSDVNGSDFDDDELFTEAVEDLFDWYETNLLFAPLSPNFRSAFVELCVHGFDHRTSLRNEDKGQVIALRIVHNSLLLLVSSPEFMVEAAMFQTLLHLSCKSWVIQPFSSK